MASVQTLEIRVAQPAGKGDAIPIVPCQWINLEAHVSMGDPGSMWHIEEVSMHFEIPGVPPVDYVIPPGVDPYVQVQLGDVLIDWEFAEGAMPCHDIVDCQWFPWGKIHVARGHYCTYFTVTADILLTGQPGPMVSNPLTFHIVPEPTTLLMFGSGIVGLAAVGRRR
jgi:hypothetical protein